MRCRHFISYGSGRWPARAEALTGITNWKERCAISPWVFVLNVGVALLLGIVIGLERQLRQHSAGLRTNALVALGRARSFRCPN